MNYICFDIGGTFVKHAVVEANGNILTQDVFPTVHESKDLFVSSLLQIITQYEKEYTIKGIGLSMPGVVDPTVGVSVTAGAIYSLYGENILEALKETVPYSVTIENDANCALLAEKLNGKAVENKDVILLTIGTGIGGAIMVNDQLIHGCQFKSGEFGMMRIHHSTDPSQTLHELASTTALVRSYQDHFGKDETINGKEIMLRMRQDKAVELVVKQWTDNIAVAIFNIATFMNPEKILIGGGISADPLLLPMVLDSLQQNIHWQDFSVPIDICAHKNNAGLLGALYCLLLEPETIAQ
ncbi:ROK family protein [Desemzia sp. RIT804]|uniref:ROK family protein n=1 Tax=Desemzia sp. RIT 804 TaxID=2810209 RepID=UPI00194F758F|nr:ROK family protein [Desemzia sp. RIT 804]MBM6614482.1 ROK family protein [Desemzia sp. RIT 804]